MWSLCDYSVRFYDFFVIFFENEQNNEKRLNSP